MPLRVTCQHCAKQFRIQKDVAGETLPCPICHVATLMEGEEVSPFDIFISYSSKDKTIADALVARLEYEGHRCWIAPRDIVPGKEWSEAIIAGLQQCRMMVLIFSNFSNSSQQVLREVERAVNRGMPIVPFRIENLMPSQAMEYFISTHHWLDAYHPPLEEHLDNLARTCATLLHGQESPREMTPRHWHSSLPKALRSLLARDSRSRIFLGAVVAMILVGVMILAGMYFLKDPKASSELLSLKSSTESMQSEWNAWEKGPGIDPLFLKLQTELRLANNLFEQKKFSEAQVSYEKTLELQEEIRKMLHERAEAKKQVILMKSVRDQAEKYLASTFAPTEWSQATQQQLAADSALQEGNFKSSLSNSIQANKAFKQSAITSRRAALPRLKSLAFWTGYSVMMVRRDLELQQIIQQIGGTAKIDLFLRPIFEEFQEILVAARTLLTQEIVKQLPRLKADITRLIEEKDFSKTLELRNGFEKYFQEYDADIAAAFWFGNNWAVLHAHSFPQIGTPREFQEGLRFARSTAFNSGCNQQIAETIDAAWQNWVKKNEGFARIEFIILDTMTKFIFPLMKKEMQDITSLTTAYGHPPFFPKQIESQQTSVKALYDAGARFIYDEDNLLPTALRFPIDPLDSINSINVVAHFEKIPSIISAGFAWQKIDDRALAKIAQRKNLVGLSLYHTDVTDGGLEHLTQLQNLEFLSLAGLPITDEGLNHLLKLKKLKLIRLEETQVTEKGIAALKASIPNLEVRH